MKSKDYLSFVCNLYWNLADLIGIRVFKVKPVALKAGEAVGSTSQVNRIDKKEKLN